jgi:hypothetical protein
MGVAHARDNVNGIHEIKGSIPISSTNSGSDFWGLKARRVSGGSVFMAPAPFRSEIRAAAASCLPGKGSPTEAVRTFSDLLNRVRYRGEEAVLAVGTLIDSSVLIAAERRALDLDAANVRSRGRVGCHRRDHRRRPSRAEPRASRGEATAGSPPILPA